jgi:hypothetical protein
MTQRLARIVPADPDSPLVRGTKVIQADGSEIRGIRKLTLVADPNAGSGRWIAHIEMNVLPPETLTGELDVTALDSTAREYRSAPASDDGLYLGALRHFATFEAVDKFMADLAAVREHAARQAAMDEATDKVVGILRQILAELQKVVPPRNTRA